MTLDLTPDDVKMTSFYANWKLTYRNERQSLIKSAFLNLSSNSLKGKVLFSTEFHRKSNEVNKKGMQEKVSIMGIWCG